MRRTLVFEANETLLAGWEMLLFLLSSSSLAVISIVSISSNSALIIPSFGAGEFDDLSFVC